MTKLNSGGIFDKIRVVNKQNLGKETMKNGGEYWDLWGIRLFGSELSEVLDKVIQIVAKESERPYWIATVNPEFVMKAAEDKEFLRILKKTDLNVVDGIGLIWAKLVAAECISPVQKMVKGFVCGVEILKGKHREELVPGVELMEEMVREAAERGKSVYFFGGWGDRAGRTAEHFRSQMSDLRCQWSAGEPYENDDVSLEKINKFEPDFLFVARGMKKQEEWIDQNINKLKVKVVMGVGRSFDYFSGDLKRSPVWLRRIGLEWLYSLYKEPKRWKRQLALPKFIWKVIFG